MSADDNNMSPEEQEMLRALEEQPETDSKENANGKEPQAEEESDAPPVAAHRADFTPLQSAPMAEADKDGNLKMIMDIPVEIKVEVGNSRLTIREILNLSPGAIIELDRTAGSPADIIVNGTIVGQGDVVIVEESYGIRITKLAAPEDRLNSL